MVAGPPIFQAFSTGVVKKNLVIKYYKYYQISDDIFGEYTVINYLNITLIRANIHTTKGKGNEKMKEFEIRVSASYIAAGSKYWNCFKEYVTAKNKTEARKILKAELKEDGYKNIEMEILEV